MGRDLSVMVKGPNVVKGNPASKPTRKPTHAATDMRGRSAYVRARAHRPLTCGAGMSVGQIKEKGLRARGGFEPGSHAPKFVRFYSVNHSVTLCFVTDTTTRTT